MRKFVYSLLVFSIPLYQAMACGERKVPIEINVEYHDPGRYKISAKAPTIYKEFYLLSGQYNNGDNTVPMYGGYREDEEFAYYEIIATKEFLKGATISINYSIKNTLCLHSEYVHWEKYLKKLD